MLNFPSASQLPTGPLMFGEYNVAPSQNLGVFFDVVVILRSNIDVVVSHCANCAVYLVMSPYRSANHW